MRRLGSEVVGGLFWLAVGIFFAVGGVKLKVGTLSKPGSGFLPLTAALLLISFSLFTLVKGLLKQEKFLGRIPWRRSALVILSVFLYMFLVNTITFLPSTFVLMTILYGLLKTVKKSWFVIILSATATALVAWLVFSVLLEVPF
jgi:hypothetical protein